jgi:hypothetical protein
VVGVGSGAGFGVCMGIWPGGQAGQGGRAGRTVIVPSGTKGEHSRAEQKVNIPVLFSGEYMLFLVWGSIYWRWAISPAHEGISK